MVTVRALSDDDIAAAVGLHLEVLDMEFLSRFGPAFMRTYYRAWIHTPGSVALVARDEGEVVGVLLGATDPGAHVRAMVRHHGARIGARLVSHAIVHPRLAKDLIVTRGWRYTRGVARLVTARLSRSPVTPLAGDQPVVGELTHVLVSPSFQGRGVGRALVEGFVDAAREVGVGELMLVTPPDLAARHFYERLGWRCEGDMRSRSGEEFLRFRYHLR